MDAISWMTDFCPVHLLYLADRAERDFALCLESCPKTEDGLIQIDAPESFLRLLEARMTSLLLALAAFEAYLGYDAAQTASQLADADPDLTLNQFLDHHRLRDHFKGLGNRDHRRHELILEENGDKPVIRFLTTAPLSLLEKLRYWTLIRTQKTISLKDGNVKKLYRLISLADELRHPNLASAPEVLKIAGEGGEKKVFLHHDLMGRLTPGKSASADYVVETYNEGHFFWELLHCYPARAIREAIQYLHLVDHSEPHFITAVCAAELTDENGRPVQEPAPRYVFAVKLDR